MSQNYYIDIYRISATNTQRFALGKKGKRMLVGLGLNPSTADDQKPDMTISKVMGLASRNGFDGFVMVNLYPLRKTFPHELPKRKNNAHHLQNLQEIQQILADQSEISILAAWGNPITERPYLKKCLKDIYETLSDQRVNWLQVGSLTKAGHPRHPSRVAYALGLQTFDIQQYLEWLG